ncbi:hypothetical protein [Photobacterium sp. DNB22_13_2]
MLTGYWSIDAFIIAMVLLCVIVAVIFGHFEWTGKGSLTSPSRNHGPKE